MNRWVFRIARLFMAGLFLGGTLSARAVEDASGGMPSAPDPASVHVPNLSFVPTPRDVGNYDEYFYFHKSGVTFPTAWNDLNECARYSIALKPMGRVITFVPLGSDASPENRFDSRDWARVWVMWGLVGSLIVGMASDEIASDNTRGNNRRCMGYKGYARYGLNRALWHEVTKGKELDTLARLALIASGPAPATGKLDP